MSFSLMVGIVFLFLLAVGVLGVWFSWIIKKTRKELLQNFQSLSLEGMERNHRTFLDLAKAVLDKYQEGMKGEWELKKQSFESSLLPVRESLHRIQEYTREVEKQREGAYGSLQKQLDALIQSEQALRKEASQLSNALRSPNVRGTWGQVQLKRVAELAGMVNHCDFFEQKNFRGEDQSYRPDVIVHLPGERQIIIDAKVPLEAYLEAMDLSDEELKRKKLEDHATQLRKHIRNLSSKEYWKQVQSTPEYVILFLPAEAFFSAALQADPSLLEHGADQGVILATPTTLIAILRAISYGWRQESLAKNAQEISKVGKELYERLQVMNGHWIRLGRSLSSAVDSFNGAIASLESRVMVSARKLQELGASSSDKEGDALEEVLKTPRSLISDESTK